ncbi:hypothetical protein HR45_03625 [Shewanella mangrovi]|uniref:Lipid/polyisoprenoid-binding YceI-like domain-containing protein n=1 Tax=Shewanella mangrovi TaxID=1515746 RepID=A0A094JF24_9GAMM|nr:YceI family protein [Shewanella mangrovi]KFZ38530.1 hypothetical protein HR45_03625 [Shewanella mangrovi]
MLKWLTTLLLLIPFAHAADWQLDKSQSHLYAISIKAAEIAEVHRFTIASASLKNDQLFSLKVELASVESGVEQRDELLRSVLFEVAKYPDFRLSASLPDDWLAGVPLARVTPLDINGTLSLHGVKRTVPLKLNVVKISEQALLVVADEPVILNARDYGLVGGLHKLAQISQLDDISNLVPINFTLVLRKDD